MNRTTEDPIWETIRAEAAEEAKREPMLASFLHAVILNHKRLEDALSFHVASKLASPTIPAISLRELFDEAFDNDLGIGKAVRADIEAHTLQHCTAAVPDRQVAHRDLDRRLSSYHFFLPRSHIRKPMERAFMMRTIAISTSATP